MAVTVTALIGLAAMLLGEGPHWIPRDQSLVLVDIPAGYMYRYYTETERVQRLKLQDLGYGASSSIIIPVKGSPDEFVITANNVLTLVNWTSADSDHVLKKPTALFTAASENRVRFNDGKVDPQGRLWTGTMGFAKAYSTSPSDFPHNQGALYRFDENLKEKVIVTNVSISNGLAWSSDKKKLYYVDSLTKYVASFDYNDVTGDISNKQILFDFEANGLMNQLPDGMAIDTDDNLWVACWGGGQVININTKTGKLIRNVSIPSSRVTSVAFGGPDFSTMFVTSAAVGLSPDEVQKSPLSGRVFKVLGLGVRGLPANEVVLSNTVLQAKTGGAN